MAVLRATQFASGLLNGTAVTNIYTVPTGKKIILKSVRLQEVSGVACTVNVRVNSFGTWMAAPLAAYPAGGSRFEERMFAVFNAGDIIQLNRSNAGQVTYVLSGSLMTI